MSFQACPHIACKDIKLFFAGIIFFVFVVTNFVGSQKTSPCLIDGVFEGSVMLSGCLFQFAFYIVDACLFDFASTHFRPFGMALYKHFATIGGN